MSDDFCKSQLIYVHFSILNIYYFHKMYYLGIFYCNKLKIDIKKILKVNSGIVWSIYGTKFKLNKNIKQNLIIKKNKWKDNSTLRKNRILDTTNKYTNSYT